MTIAEKCHDLADRIAEYQSGEPLTPPHIAAWFQELCDVVAQLSKQMETKATELQDDLADTRALLELLTAGDQPKKGQ